MLFCRPIHWKTLVLVRSSVILAEKIDSDKDVNSKHILFDQFITLRFVYYVQEKKGRMISNKYC